MTNLDRYIQGRLDGLTDSEAASEAGYSSKAPGDARKTWERVELLRDGSKPYTTTDLQAQVDSLKAKAERVRMALVEANRWLYAAELLERLRL